MIFLENSTTNRKKKLVLEKLTSIDNIFDTKNYILCVVYDEIVDQKLFENLNI